MPCPYKRINNFLFKFNIFYGNNYDNVSSRTSPRKIVSNLIREPCEYEDGVKFLKPSLLHSSWLLQ